MLWAGTINVSLMGQEQVHNLYLAQANWGVLSEYCNGDAQSPIDITGATVKPRSDFVQTNYDETLQWFGENDGHTIKFTLSDDPLTVVP